MKLRQRRMIIVGVHWCFDDAVRHRVDGRVIWIDPFQVDAIGANRRVFHAADNADLWRVHFDKPENESPFCLSLYITGGLQAR
jgi:hypothetical protein